ncbi:MAG: polysaccharide deacetylase family protein [Acidimicrobiales bacterium]
MIDRRTFLAATAAAFASACSGGGSPQVSPASSDATSPQSSAGANASTATTTAPAAATTVRTPGAPSVFVTRAASTRNEVALTFHTDGDLRIAQRLLDGLAGRAQITCFIVGSWLDANPTWARKLLDAGHELANHTYTHPTFTTLSPAAMATEITRCRDLLTKLTGNGGRFFRPSGTDDGLAKPSDAILQAAGTAGYDYVLGWDVEPFDYQDPGGTAVRTRVLDGTKPGSIVSMHFGHSGTADAISAILDGFDRQGIKPVTVSTLLAK